MPSRSFSELSLLSECHKWSPRRPCCCSTTPLRGSRQGDGVAGVRHVSSTWTRGNGDDVRADDHARRWKSRPSRGDTSTRLRLLAGLHMFLLRAADIRGLARRSRRKWRARRELRKTPPYGIVADWLLGCSQHFHWVISPPPGCICKKRLDPPRLSARSCSGWTSGCGRSSCIHRVSVAQRLSRARARGCVGHDY